MTGFGAVIGERSFLMKQGYGKPGARPFEGIAPVGTWREVVTPPNFGISVS
jgi:hypothetical protein